MVNRLAPVSRCLIYEEEQIVSMGSIVSGRTLLRSGHAPIRVEFFQQDGEAPPALALRWMGENEVPRQGSRARREHRRREPRAAENGAARGGSSTPLATRYSA